MRHFLHATWLIFLLGGIHRLESAEGSGRNAPPPDDSSPGLVGKRYRAERSVYRDERTGHAVVRLTSSPAEDVKAYQTHPSWTADGRWIVFHSNRTGEEQLFAVHEENGAIVQLTDEPRVQVGQVCLSRSRPELLTVVGDDFVRIRLRGLLEEGSGPSSDYRSTVGRIPPGARLAGTISWDAAEKELYIGLTYPGRPAARRWSIASLALDSGELRTVIDLDFRVGHVQANPRTAGLILYCHETGGDAPQRMWIVHRDGSENRPFYRETFDEWVTHELWWDERRSLFTVWPRDDAMRRKPHGIASVSLDGAVKFHSRFPYWHVTGVAGGRYGVGDTFDGRIFRVDLGTGDQVLLTQGHRPKKEGAHLHPTLHPRGERVLFNSNAGGNADLYVVGLQEESTDAVFSRERRRTRRYTTGTPREATRWQAELRSRLAKLLRLSDLDGKKLRLEPRTIRTETREKYVLEEVEIRSTAKRRIRVLVTTPSASDGRHPAVVCIHGHGGNRRVVYEPGIYKGFASSLAATGFVTIAADVGQHEVLEVGRSLMGERLWDLMRCVDYLETLPGVDRSRIGCAGLSLGGEMAMWLGAMDERIAATVSSGFLTTMDQMEQNHCMCWKFDGLRELVDYADIYSLIAPRALQCQNGLRESATDFWVPLARAEMQDIRRIYEVLGQREKAGLVVHEGGHEIDLAALSSFFEERLK